MGNPLYRGGFADVWKGEHCGRDVAIKVLRIYSNSDLQKIIGVSHRHASCPCANLLMAPPSEILQRGCDMEDTPSSKRATADRRDNDRGSLCNYLGLDGERKH
jgi:hypothetical protein